MWLLFNLTAAQPLGNFLSVACDLKLTIEIDRTLKNELLLQLHNE